MCKKNKGFTLIEVLATIAIIAVVTLIATITYSKVRKTLIRREYNNLKSLIEIAGVKYASKTGIKAFFVRDLIEEGYLEPDDETENIYDPRDDHSLNCHIVSVVFDEKENPVATLSKISYEVNDGCDTSKTDKYKTDFNISVLITKTTINYLGTTSQGSKLSSDPKDIYKNINIINGWTNKQVDITANILRESGFLPYYVDITGAKYVWNKNPDNTTTEPTRTFTTNIDEFYNAYYYVDIYTKDERHLQTKFLLKYDNQKPVIYDNKFKYANPLEEEMWRKSKTVLIYATDKDGVGLDRVYAGTRPCEDLLKDNSMGKAAVPNSQVHTYTVDDVEAGKVGENGEINLCAVDKLGNLAETKKTVVKKIDITKPHCTKDLVANRSQDVIGEHNKYQYAARTIHQYCYDNNKINGKLVEGSGCIKNPFIKTWETTTKKDTITIEDNVGWKTECPVDVYVDRTAPNCYYSTGYGNTSTGVGSENNWDQEYRYITQYCSDDHVGCKESSYSKDWTWSDSKPIIRTDTIKIYDKVPKCSQKSVTSTNCANYDSIKNTAENLDDYNNSRVCTEGVYIDHLPPVATQGGLNVHDLNRVKVSCSDPSYGGVAGSGVASFTAQPVSPTPTGNITAADRVKKSNTTGGRLEFKATLPSSISYPADNIHIQTTCVDKAGNQDQTRDLVFEAALAYSSGNNYLEDMGIGSNYGTCSTGCKLREWRTVSEGSCINHSYDCGCQDKACDSNNNGAGRTCCLSGPDKIYGCKKHAGGDPTRFGKSLEVVTYSSVASYILYNNEYYVTPDPQSIEYGAYCDAKEGECAAGYKCEIFNCWADNPSVGNTTGTAYNSWICGNFTR